MTTPSEPAPQDKARRQMMAGVMLVMLACMFGGLTAVLLMALGQRDGAAVVALIAGLLVVAGIAIQIVGFRKMRAVSQAVSK